jgi:diacylglycerol kinase (ATP)
MTPRNKFRPGSRPSYQPWRKITIALRGLRYAVIFDLTVQYKLVLTLAALILALFLLSGGQFLTMLLASGFMLGAEVMNSAVEAVCDYVQPEYDEKIKVIKDMAAGAALLAVLVWWAVLGFTVWRLARISWM